MPPQSEIEPSDWVKRWSRLIPPAGAVVDLACGAGRHSRWLASQGYRVLAVDREEAIVAPLRSCTGVEVEVADLETGSWPLAGRRFAGIVVTNYLHRPLFAHLLESLADRGVLIYETFAAGNEKFGKPSNPDFLLADGELLDRVRGRLRVVAYEAVQSEQPRPAMVQRLCAVAGQPVP